ncbi:MAG TPA: hypothetical protein VLT51_10480 [Anaerolineales bacterium]|nr:hypothetical protein [Anaerolineales bacterium]
MAPILSWSVIALLAITSVGILLAHDWRWLIIFLSAQYIGVFILTLEHWPLGMATVKVIAGWMSAAILGMTRSNLDAEEENKNTLPQGRFFRFIAASVVGLIVLTGTPFIDAMMADAGMAVSAGSLLLVGMGLLHLGVTDQSMRVTAGLMTVLAGFEILYAAVENSILVAALLAIINLGLALVGSYLMIASSTNETETP